MHIRVDQYIPVSCPLDGEDRNAGCLRQSGRVRRRHARVPVSLHDGDAVYMTNSLIGVMRVEKFETSRYDMRIDEHPLVGEARSLCHAPRVTA